MKLSLNYIFFLLIALIVFKSCGPDDDCLDCTDPELPPPIDTLRMSDTLKNFYYFGEGSWWVYQRTDTNAAVYDTATLIRSNRTIWYNRNSFPYAWEQLGTAVEHSYYPSLPNAVNPKLEVGTGNLNVVVDVIGMESQGSLFRSVDDFLSLPLDSLSISIKSQGLAKFLGIKTLIIGNSQFENTVNIQYGVEGFTYDIWITPNIGLTKYFNAGDNTEWELIDYEIKP